MTLISVTFVLLVVMVKGALAALFHFPFVVAGRLLVLVLFARDQLCWKRPFRFG